MKRVLLVGLLVVGLHGTAEASIVNDVLGGIGDVAKSAVQVAKRSVSTAVTVSHAGLHIVQSVAGGLMQVSHSTLDLFNLPFENGG